MKIKITDGVVKEKIVSEIVDLSNFDIKHIYSLKGIDPFELHVRFETMEEEVYVEVSADVTLTLECAYTLELFKQTYELDEELCFNFVNPKIEAESDECFYEKGPYIELDEYIFALVTMLVPMQAIKPGATLPKSGNGYQVINEEEYFKQKAEMRTETDDLLDQIETKD